MEHPIGALPRTPFPASRDFPSRGNEGYEEKIRQEKRPFLEIRDSFEKIIVVRDRILPWRDENGILIMGLQDFLGTWDREK